MKSSLAAILLFGVQLGCRAVERAAPSPVGTAGSAFSSSGGQVAAVRPGLITRETVDLTKCQPAKPLTEKQEHEQEQGRDPLIECALSPGLVAQQNGSACFNVNRLLDAQGEALFESELFSPNHSVFVVDGKFELYRCEGRAIAVLQSGEYFAEDMGKNNACHGDTALRRAFSVADLLKKKRYDGLTLSDAKTSLMRIARSSSCSDADLSLP